MMEVNNDNISPVKIYNQASLEVKAYNCLICGRRSGKETLRNPREKGVSTFISSLIVRGNCNGFPVSAYNGIFDITNKTLEAGETNVRWHRKCYSTFTNSCNLEYVAPVDSPAEDKLPKTRSQKPLIDLKSCCMFCGLKKHKNDTRLILLQYDNVISKIRKACETNDDTEFKRKIGGNFEDLPALDAKYHLKCYVKYTKGTKPSNELSVHDVAFDILCDQINLQLEEGRAIELPTLLSKYQEILQDKEYEHFNLYATQKLKQRLIKRYGSSVKFTETVNAAQSMYSSQISISDIINAAATYKQLVKDNELINVDESEDKLLNRAADILIRDIRNVEGISINPLDPADISIDVVKNIIPKKLNDFLSHICLAKRTKEKEKKVLSIAQDIVSLQSSGRKRMPKHVGLAVSLKNSLRSKEFIRYLNNLGHCICYDDVLRIDTSWAAGLIEEGDGYATIPTNIVPGIFTHAAFDNGDYGQENASQHVTNTVLYQCKHGTFGIEASKIPFAKSRRRSACIQPEALETMNNYQKPELPGSYSKSRLDLNKCFSQTLLKSTDTTISWILLRHLSSKLFLTEFSQNIPDWTGFRKIVSVKVSFPTTIGNCRTVPASPTDFNVVYTVMLNVKRMLNSLGQEDPCVTVDESIYQIAKQIQWRIPFLQDVTVRLGGFHRAKNFLGVIGKRMRSTGFSEILDEAGLYGATQIEGNLCISPLYCIS